MDEVELWCAVYGEATVFPVNIARHAEVRALHEKVFYKQRYDHQYKLPASALTLYLARNKGEATWMKHDHNTRHFLQGDIDAGYEKMHPSWILGEDYLGDDFQPGDEEIHVLVELPQAVAGRRYDAALGAEEEPPHKKRRRWITWKEEEFESIEHQLDIDSWEVGGVSPDICRVELDFPDWFYVRKETLDIFKVFKAEREANRSIVFQGAPGVGKSLLVVVLAFYIALRKRKRVVLLRKLKGVGFCLLYMDAENKQYWRIDRAHVEDLDRVWDRDFELCLDGFEYDDIQRYFGRLARYRLLATPDRYSLKSSDIPVLRRCLVPFWSLSDLTAIGAHREWSDHEIQGRYFYSGGNLRAFLAPKSARAFVTSLILCATRLEALKHAQLLDTQHGGPSDLDVDFLRMPGVRPIGLDHQDLRKYIDCASWVYVITSEYALRCLGSIVQPSYYKELWAKGRLLADDGLMDIASRSYVHTLARAGEKMELQVRECDCAADTPHGFAMAT